MREFRNQSFIRQTPLDKLFDLNDIVKLRSNGEYPFYVLRDDDYKNVYLINNRFYDENLKEIEKKARLSLYTTDFLTKKQHSDILYLYLRTHR